MQSLRGVQRYTSCESKTVGFGVGGLAAVTRRPPISLDTIVARTRMYTYAATVWELSIVKVHFLSPRAKP
jgi:hypothetical protein